MSNNKKYYWLKLKEDFFDKKDIRYLRSLPDGDKLIIIYLMIPEKRFQFINYSGLKMMLKLNCTVSGKKSINRIS